MRRNGASSVARNPLAERSTDSVSRALNGLGDLVELLQRNVADELHREVNLLRGRGAVRGKIVRERREQARGRLRRRVDRDEETHRLALAVPLHA
jgi:hypothetical protein